ncbi:MAG: hypothetical protein ABI972_31095 [Acidobacteriota bacterium]
MHLTHGMSKTPTHRSWAHMLERCRNPRCRQFKWYGARGVTVHASWYDYQSFVSDMGPRPEGTTLDRINRDLGYGPNNCRWADSKTQQRNRSNVKLTAETVAEIRRLHIPRVVTHRMLAARFGVAEDTIAIAIRGETWRSSTRSDGCAVCTRSGGGRRDASY